MQTKTCPICDQVIKGSYCKTCHRFVTPVVNETTFRLNESNYDQNYVRLQLENDTKLNECQTPHAHPAPNYAPAGEQLRIPNIPYADSAQGRTPAYSSMGAGNVGEVKKKKRTGLQVVVIVLIILAIVQLLIPLLLSYAI